MEVHPTAVISPQAELAQGVKVGPYSIVGDYVTIGRDTEVGAHVAIDCNTRIGERNKIYPFASLGTPPQDIGYGQEDTRLIMGNDNVVSWAERRQAFFPQINAAHPLCLC